MLQMTKREYATKPADYRSMIDGKPYLLTMDKTTGGTVLTPVILKANPTLATIKSFIRKSPRYISRIYPILTAWWIVLCLATIKGLGL